MSRRTRPPTRRRARSWASSAARSCTSATRSTTRRSSTGRRRLLPRTTGSGLTPGRRSEAERSRPPRFPGALRPSPRPARASARAGRGVVARLLPGGAVPAAADVAVAAGRVYRGARPQVVVLELRQAVHGRGRAVAAGLLPHHRARRFGDGVRRDLGVPARVVHGPRRAAALADAGVPAGRGAAVVVDPRPDLLLAHDPRRPG